MTGISDPIYASASLPANPLLDSNLRVFGGVWFGLGLALYWLIPKIEKQTVLFRAIWGMIFLGGIWSSAPGQRCPRNVGLHFNSGYRCAARNDATGRYWQSTRC
jgi:hypothetical protein